MYFSDIRAQGASHCHATFQSTTVACDPLSEKSSDLNGWNLSLEKNTFAIFAAVADFSGQYGGVTQKDFLFGLRGGAPIGRLRPFAEALIGAVHARENGLAAANSATSFAEALGVGVDFQLLRLLG